MFRCGELQLISLLRLMRKKFQESSSSFQITFWNLITSFYEYVYFQSNKNDDYRWYYFAIKLFLVYLNTGSYRFNLAHIITNKSCEICGNKWFFRFIKCRSSFLSTDSLTDAISISIIISCPIQSRNSITRVGNSGGLEFTEPHDPYARKGFQECVSDHRVLGIYWKWLPWFLLDVTKITLSAFVNRRISLRQFAK